MDFFPSFVVEIVLVAIGQTIGFFVYISRLSARVAVIEKQVEILVEDFSKWEDRQWNENK